jgi:hypothetical protein
MNLDEQNPRIDECGDEREGGSYNKPIEPSSSTEKE